MAFDAGKRPNRRVVAVEISSTAASNASAFFGAGARKPDTFRTNWSAAARTSSSVAGVGVRRVRIERHIFLVLSPYFTLSAAGVR